MTDSTCSFRSDRNKNMSPWWIDIKWHKCFPFHVNAHQQNKFRQEPRAGLSFAFHPELSSSHQTHTFTLWFHSTAHFAGIYTVSLTPVLFYFSMYDNVVAACLNLKPLPLRNPSALWLAAHALCARSTQSHICPQWSSLRHPFKTTFFCYIAKILFAAIPPSVCNTGY